MADLDITPTTPELVGSWRRVAERVLKAAAPTGRLTPATGAKLRSQPDTRQLFGDTVIREIGAAQQKSMSTQKLLGRAQSRLETSARAHEGGNHKLSLTELRQLDPDFVPAALYLRGKLALPGGFVLDAATLKAMSDSVNAAIWDDEGFAGLLAGMVGGDVNRYTAAIACMDAELVRRVAGFAGKSYPDKDAARAAIDAERVDIIRRVKTERLDYLRQIGLP